MTTPTPEWAGQINSAFGELLQRLTRLETLVESIDDAAVSLEGRVTAVEGKVAEVEAQVEALSESLVRHQDNEGRHGR